MTRRVAILVLLAGCAAGRVTPSGDVQGVAIGRAKIEHCVRVDGKPQCNRISGGSLSSGLAEAVEAALTAIGAWWGAGA